MNTLILIMLAALESPFFETRQLAEQELRAQGITSLPYLQITENTSLDAKVKINRLKTEIVAVYTKAWVDNKKWKKINDVCDISPNYDYYGQVRAIYCIEHDIAEDQFWEISSENYALVEDLERDATKLWVLDWIAAGESFEKILRTFSE